MRKAFGDYRRLARGAFSCSSLWAGPEHLLYVKGTGLLMPVVEEYIRVRYRDIAGVTVAKTRVSLVLSLIGAVGLASVAVLMVVVGAGVAAIGDGAEPEFWVLVVTLSVLSLFAIGFLVLLVWNIARGRSVVFAIQTARGLTKIRPAGRQRTALRLRDEIAALVGEQQQQQPVGVAGPQAASGQPGGGVGPVADGTDGSVPRTKPTGGTGDGGTR